MSKNMDIAKLKPAPYNPRTITKEELEGLQHSMQKFGDISGIVFNRTTGNLVAAHQRIEILNSFANESEIEILETFEKPTKCGTIAYGYVKNFGAERFSYREVEWDEQTEKLANIAANNPKIQGKFKLELSDLLLELKEIEGFEELRLNELQDLYLSQSDEDKDFSVHNREINVNELTKDLSHTCPKCGFQFKTET